MSSPGAAPTQLRGRAGWGNQHLLHPVTASSLPVYEERPRQEVGGDGEDGGGTDEDDDVVQAPEPTAMTERLLVRGWAHGGCDVDGAPVIMGPGAQTEHVAAGVQVACVWTSSPTHTAKGERERKMLE